MDDIEIEEKRLAMMFAALLMLLGISASSQTPLVSLPAGVKSVSFGQAQRYGGVFDRGVTEISYTVELEPRVVKSASARVVAPAGQELRTDACNAFTPIKGGFSQTQLGSSISRVDKAPLRPGRYTLRVTVDGQAAEVPFTIK
jgi:hypothetical protein